MKNNKSSDQWSSRLAFILATTGAAVGLGNIWRFPYMAGTHGGSAFVLIYILFVVFFGLPIMIAEILIGRVGRQNPVESLKTIAIDAGHSTAWRWLGWLGALALLMILAFYSVVSGWALGYLSYSIAGDLYHRTPAEVTALWTHFLSQPGLLLLWHTLFMALTIGVVAKGVQHGLERATKVMMPALYLILFVLVIYAWHSGDMRQAVHFLFDFKIQAINGQIIIAAMGHAFFTLALGAGALLMYGAYTPKRIQLTSTVVTVAALDVLVALLAGLAIFPIVFQHHLAVNQGPGLMFVTLPIAFAKDFTGSLIASLFFILLIFAAWTSSINLAEPLVSILCRAWGCRRPMASFIVGVMAWGLGLVSLFSFNIWSHVTLWHHFSLFDLATNIPMDFLLPIGGLGFACFAGYVLSAHKIKGEFKPAVFAVWRFLIRIVAPIGIIIMFLSPLWSH